MPGLICAPWTALTGNIPQGNTGSSPGPETGKEKSLCNKNMENLLLTPAAASVLCTWSRRGVNCPSVQEGAENGTEQILQGLFREKAQGDPCSALSALPLPLCQEIQTPTRVKAAHPNLCRAECLNNYKQLFIITYIYNYKRNYTEVITNAWCNCNRDVWLLQCYSE